MVIPLLFAIKESIINYKFCHLQKLCLFLGSSEFESRQKHAVLTDILGLHLSL